MKQPATSFVLALVSVVLSPILIFIQFTSWIFAAMVTYEPANSLVVKVLSVAVVVLVGLVAFAVPVMAVITGIRARSASRAMATGGSGLATAGAVIGVIVTVGVLAAQVYMVLMAVGPCSLEGC